MMYLILREIDYETIDNSYDVMKISQPTMEKANDMVQGYSINKTEKRGHNIIQ